MSAQPKAIFIKDYSKKLSTKICDDFFASNSVIEGKQIVDLHPVRQVNLFVVNTIFFEWQKETAKLRSPFFNYKSPEVKEAYNNLINLLSKNISIERKFFEPILEKSIQETLTYLISPSSHFEIKFKEADGKIYIARQLLPTGKYFSIHADLIKAFFQKLKNEEPKLKAKKIIKILDKIIEKEPDLLDEIDDTLESFSNLIPISREDLIYSEEEYQEKQKDELFNFTENGDDDFEYEDFENVEDNFSKEEEVTIHQEASTPMEEEEKPLLEKEEQDEENLIKAEIPSDDVEIKESEEPENVVPPIIPENEISLEDIEEEIKIEEETEKEEEPKIKPENNSSPSYEWNQPVEESPKEEEAPKETSDFSSEFDDDLLDESEFEEASEEKKVDFFDKPAQPKEEVNTPAVEETVLDKIQQQETKEETPKENLHSKFAGKQEKENEEEEKEENDVYSALLDKLDKGDVKPLKGNISLNLKFKFQNELFGGSNEEFNHAIELIDGCDNYHAAISLIKERYVNKYNWDFGEESTIEFLSMVDGKY
ncbi:hypothetical protein [Flexithrix dorotheae]|uniref:hypothetical protein n=1 Tax=Flexithrix dorotheae TaxID=70993 RepID=UPI00037DFE83|nr:hypothetical protein [Flexithrix dorotheae]